MPIQKCPFGVIYAVIASLILPLVLVSAAPAQQPSPEGVIGQQLGLASLRQEFPGVRSFQTPDGRIGRLFGVPFGGGASPVRAAERFIQDHVDIWGVTPDQVILQGLHPAAPSITPLMFDDQTGQYKFTAVHFAQQFAGVPVFRGRLTLLARNSDGSPLVLAAADLRNLGGFGIEDKPKQINTGAINADARRRIGDGSQVLSSRYVIFAGIDDQPAPPSLGIEYVAELDIPGTYAKWLFIIDARTGALLYEEDQVLHADVTGNVSGVAGDGIGATVCGTVSTQPLPYARIAIGPTVVFADVNGDYIIDDGGAAPPVTVESGIRGQYFQVFNQAEPDNVQTQDVTPPTTANFLYDPALHTTPEYMQAEIDAYIHSNVVRDFVLDVNPVYPVIGTQLEWPVNVNLNNNCNAFYNGSSINFYTSGGGCNNTAFDSVVYHEYGHHLVNVGGSGQGQYGEGMSDCVALLITDDPRLGVGFSNCANGIRNADNSFQYPCAGGVHFCGNLISGCVWDLREELEITEPVDFRDIVADLTINSIPLHVGSLITPQITLDFLTLDDDNANIYDGTPHFDEIMNAFLAHNMNPNLAALTFSFPNGLPAMMHPANGTTIRVEVLADNATPVPGTGMLHYDAGGGIVSVPMVQISDNVYDAILPSVDCGDIVTYSFSAQSDLPYTQEYPAPFSGTTLSVRAAMSITDLFVDDLEVDNGWSVLDGGTLSDGTWERGVPVNWGRGDPPVDGDGSGNCFLTDNDPADSNSDVDNGSTTLTSPVMDATGANTVAYWRWFSNATGSSPFQDIFIVEVSDDAGATWQFLEQAGPTADADGGWIFAENSLLGLTDFEVNNQFQIRFTASDTDPQSIVEAAIDGVSFRVVSCEPLVPGDITGDGTVGIPDLLVLLAAWGPCQPQAPCWQDTNNDGTIDIVDLLFMLSNWG